MASAHRSSVIRTLTLSFVFCAAALSASAAKGGPPVADTPVTGELAPLYRLTSDGLGPYPHNVNGARSVFSSSNYILDLDHYGVSPTVRQASIDLMSSATGGPALGSESNSSLNLNVRGQIETMDVGELRYVEALMEVIVGGRKYRLNLNGNYGSSLVAVTRGETGWLVQAAPGSTAVVTDITRKATRVGTYYVDFDLRITAP